MNLSIVLPNDVLGEFIDHIKLEMLNGKYKPDDVEALDKTQLMYVEDLVYDIINSDKLESDYS
jgi:hypothetical protein